jgi:hypothetical protein
VRILSKLSSKFDLYPSVSTLVLIAGNDDLDFGKTIKAQIKELQDQVRKHPPSVAGASVQSGSGKYGAPSELGYAREILQRLAGPDVQRSLTSQTVLPSSSTILRRWI